MQALEETAPTSTQTRQRPARPQPGAAASTASVSGIFIPSRDGAMSRAAAAEAGKFQRLATAARRSSRRSGA